MNPERLALYRQLANVAWIEADGSGLLASVHPDLRPVGGLSAPTGDTSGNAAAIEAGEEWLRARGCTHARGPIEVCTWFPYRASLGPYDRVPFLLEPTASSDPWIDAGYELEARYSSVLVTNASLVSGTTSHQSRSVGFTIRDLDLEHFDDELARLYDVTLTAYAQAFAYTPIPYLAFQALYTPFRDGIDPRMVKLAFANDGRVAGYCFCYPDPNPALRQFVIKTLAVHPRFRGSGLGTALVAACHATAEGLGYTGGGIHALMWQDSLSTRIGSHGEHHRIRDYGLFRKELAP